uniref:DNA-directed DNA polymerase n=1 Tax=Tanacetum cinerariifolium TaxID=118510 RepID=A0A699H8S7_TANCI|nr:DNA-directed DNA polymerase [Tanacetum cinerariifolium]
MIFDGLVKNVNNKGEGSSTPTEPHHTSSPKAQLPSHTTHTSPTLPPITTTSLPTVTPTETTPIWDVSQGEACPIDFGFIADQDRATIDKSSTLPYDSAPRVTSPAAIEGSMQQTIPELTSLCTSLQMQLFELTDKFQAQEVEINLLKEMIKLLEDKGVAATRSGDDALIKGSNMNEREVATERISDNTEEMATILTSMDATTVLASGVIDIPTASRPIPTASTPAEEQVPTGSDVVPTASSVQEVPTGSDVVPTASLVFATATVIDAQVARELEEQLEKEDQRTFEQIARDAEITRIHVEEELQIMIDGLDRNNETVAKYLQEYHPFASELPIKRRIELITNLVKYQDHYAKVHKYQSQQRKPRTKKQKRDYYMAVIRNNLGWKVKDFKEITFEEVEAKFKTIWEQIEDSVSKISMEKATWFKRKGIRLEQKQVKKMKTLEESSEEVFEEKIKEMIQLVPIEEAIAWKIFGIKGIDPRFCTYKILMEDEYKPAVKSQRRVNPKIHDVIKKEVIKLLDAGMIYPISNSPWVSPIHCVPKKGGMTIVANENNKLILTSLVTDWRVCIDYRKLNDATRKDHFPLPFMDQMLEREGIVLGHKISKSGIEVDRAKVDDFSKIARPMTHLLEKETPFVFPKECIDAFNTLKKKITEAPILVVPNLNLPFELMCDASDYAIGVVLGQRKSKHFQPIHYASKTMTEAQIHYTTTEKEMLAVVYAFEKFRPYLVLSKSIVYTDHSALKYLLNKQDAKPRKLLKFLKLAIRDLPGAIIVQISQRRRQGQISQKDEMPQNSIQVFEIFDIGLKTRWSRPFTIIRVFPYGTIELSQPNGLNFKVNGHRVKHYFDGNIPSNVALDLHTFHKDI